MSSGGRGSGLDADIPLPRVYIKGVHVLLVPCRRTRGSRGSLAARRPPRRRVPPLPTCIGAVRRRAARVQSNACVSSELKRTKILNLPDTFPAPAAGGARQRVRAPAGGASRVRWSRPRRRAAKKATPTGRRREWLLVVVPLREGGFDGLEERG